jgi:hypothetical protein
MLREEHAERIQRFKTVYFKREVSRGAAEKVGRRG